VLSSLRIELDVELYVEVLSLSLREATGAHNL